MNFKHANKNIVQRHHETANFQSKIEHSKKNNPDNFV